MRLFLFLISIVLIQKAAICQNYDVREVELDKTKSKGAVYRGIDNNGMIYATGYRTFLLYFNRTFLKVIDPINEKVIKDIPFKFKKLSSQGFSLYGIKMLDRNPVIIATNRKDRDDNGYYAFGLDRELRLLSGSKIAEKPVCSGFSLRQSEVKGFYSGVRHYEDDNRMRTFFSDVTCPKDEEVTIKSTVVNENGNELNSYTFTLDVITPIRKSVLLAHNENKAYYFVSSSQRERVKGKLFKRNISYNKLFVVNNGVPSEVDLSIGDNHVIADLRMVKNDGEIIVSGHINKNLSNDFVGMFTAKIDTETDELINIKTHFFDQDFMDNFWKRKEDDSQMEDTLSLRNYVLLDYFETDDGGAAYFSQEREVVQRTYTTMSADGRMTTTTRYYYYYRNLIVTKIDKNGDLVWFKNLPISQVTIDYDPGIGFAASQNRGDILVLHSSSNVRSEEIDDSADKNKRSRLRDRRTDRIDITKIQDNGEVRNDKVIDLRDSKIVFDPSNVGVDHINKTFSLLSQKRGWFASKKVIYLTKIRF